MARLFRGVFHADHLHDNGMLDLGIGRHHFTRDLRLCDILLEGSERFLHRDRKGVSHNVSAPTI